MTLEALREIERHKLVVVIRTETPEQAYEAALACVRGGVKLIEITFSVPDAHEVIRKLVGTGGITVGAGTVLTIPEAVSARDAGAAFIVSPHFDREIVGFTKAEGAVSIPGASTPTEILKAHQAGADIIKLFPFVEMGGLGFLKTIRGPLPFIRYMPSGGVTIENVSAYLSAGVAGIIAGSAIIRPEMVRKGDWQGIAGLAADFVRKVESIQPGGA
jgi:2-dehydro-3-deoxyphosphogluconate aldolase/(4S)-4-hydroxy-2-oxoglutarate aldolase